MLKRMSDVVSTTALETSKADFLSTHMAFNNLKFESISGNVSTSDEMNEEVYFQNNIQRLREEHNLIIIKGNNGSGKSHLTRWLYHKYENEIDTNEELILLINRGENTLKGALSQIVNSELFSNVENNIEIRKLIEANDSLSNKEITQQIAALLAAAIESDDNEDEILKKRIKNSLFSFLTDEVIRDELLLIKKGPINRIASKLAITKDDFQNDKEPKFYPEDFEIEFGGKIINEMKQGERKSSQRAMRLAEMIANKDSNPNLKSDICIYLNNKIDEVIQSIIKVNRTDLSEAFKTIRKSLKERSIKLTLFIEDITSFAGINKELLETLLVTHRENGELCRLTSFVGITNSYYDDSIPSNIRDRVTGMISITEGSIIKTIDDSAEMIGRYLNSIRLPESTIKGWMNDGASPTSLPMDNSYKDKKWSIHKLSNGKEVSLFPFNKVALWNIYKGIKETERSPRTFLKVVFFDLYQRYYNNPKNFPPRQEELNNIKYPRWPDELMENMILQNHPGEIGERISALIRLWGNSTINEANVNGQVLIGGLDRIVFEEFNLPIINGTGDKGPIIDPIPPPTPKPDPIPTFVPQDGKDYIKYLDELNNWLSGGQLINHKRFREDLCKLIGNFFDWEYERISPLLMNQFITLNNIYIEGQSSEIKTGFIMERSRLSYNILLGIISWRYKGNKTWNFDNSSEYALIISKYLEDNKDNILDIVRYPTNQLKAGWEYERWVIANNYYAALLNGNIGAEMNNEDILVSLFNLEFELNKDVMFNDIWKSTIIRISRDSEINENRIQMIRYFNLILGEANPITTPVFYLNTVDILENISELQKSDWKFNNKNQIFDNISQSVHYLPIRIYNKFWNGTLIKIANQEMESIRGYRKYLEENIGIDFKKEDIDTLNFTMKRYLEESLHSINENYDEQKFNIITMQKIKSQNIVDCYNKIIDLERSENISQLINLSTKFHLEIEKYINTLKYFIDKTELVNSKLNRYMSGISIDTIERLTILEKSIVDTVTKINLNSYKI